MSLIEKDRPDAAGAASVPVRQASLARTASRRGVFGRLGLAAAAASLALAACSSGDYYDPYYDPGPTACGGTAVPAVVVEFVSRATGENVPVNAAGAILYGTVNETMIPWQTDGAGYGRLWSLAGGFDHAPDTFDISVVTQAGERFDWPGVAVGAASCGPATVLLQAPVSYY